MRKRRSASRRHVRQALNSLLAVMILLATQLLGPYACHATQALAASGNDPKTVTFSNEYRHQLDDQEAYCTNIDITPPEEGQVLSSWTSGPLMLDYVLYHGEGGGDPTYGWEPTRYAVWAVMHQDLTYLTTYGSGEAMPEAFSAQVKALYYAADEWVKAGATGPELGCSRIYAPISNEYQPVAICVPQLGELTLEKQSARTDITQGDACYSLEGAVFTVYSDRDCTTPVATLASDAQGKTETAQLAQGTYWVQETTAPKGFLLDRQVYEVQVSANTTAVVNDGQVLDQPVVAQVETLVRKVDAQASLLGDDAAQGDATLAGAQFTATRFANTDGKTDGSPTRTWVIQTDSDGVATLDDDHLVSGDKLYRDQDGAVVLPLGTYSIVETRAPEGYALPKGQEGVLLVTQEGQRALVRVVSGPTPSTPRAHDPLFQFGDDVVRGGVRLGKVDAQRADHVAQGGATLQGAVLAIELASEQPVIVEGNTFTTGSVVTTLTIGEDGTAQTALDALPYGTYVAYEVETSKGYLLTPRSAWSTSFSIRENGELVDLSDTESSVPQQVKRGDFSFVKVDGTSMRRMADVPFVIESLTTGERHVLVTDQNGQASTLASFAAHSADTNANDWVLERGAQESLQPMGDETSNVANDAQVTEGADSAELEHVEDGESASASEDASLVGETTQTEEATAVEAANGAGASVDSATRDVIVPPVDVVVEEPSVAAEGELLLGLAVDQDLVVEDGLTAVEDEVVVQGDTDDAAEDQAPALGNSVAEDDEAASTDAEGTPSELAEQGAADTSAEDTVADDASSQADDQGDADALTALSADNQELNDRAGVWFSGGTDVTVPVDDQLGALPYDTYRVTELPCAANEGYDLVSFEISIVRDHFEVDGGTVDDQQHLTPLLHTQLSVVSTQENGNVWQLSDVVQYENLQADGTEYELRGSLHLVGADGADLGVITDSAGNEAVVSTTFVPSASSGSTEVPFQIHVGDLRGNTIVAFEELWLDGRLVASHADPTDEDQSVSVPSIGTTLTGADGSKELDGTGSVLLVDIVHYQGLIPGKTYQLVGTLMDKATGEALTDQDGMPIEAQATLVADAPEGEASVTFAFDGVLARGKTLVAFESLWRDNLELATHADLQDQAQTVTVPRIGTTAHDASDGDHELFASEDATIVDTVTYQGLVPYEEYVLQATLVDRATGQPVVIGGKPVTSELTFTPLSADGEVETTLKLDATALAGTQVTVFETLLRGNTVVATHHDPSSDEQSLSIPLIRTSAATPDGQKRLDAASKQRIVDTVSYVGLTPGKGYVVTGTLHLRDTDGTDLGPIADAEGKPLTSSAPLVAEAAQGATTVTFEIDASELGGRSLVAFEVLTDAETGSVVATHEDIADGGQTVTVNPAPEKPNKPSKQTTALLPKTGDVALPIATFATLATGALGLGAALRVHEHRASKRGNHLK